MARGIAAVAVKAAPFCQLGKSGGQKEGRLGQPKQAQNGHLPNAASC